jgi:hypothetical protein
MSMTFKFPVDAELNGMLRALAREMDLPFGIHPDLVGPDLDYHGYWGPSEEERHRQSVAARHRLIAWLQQHPEWIEEYRAEQRLDERIKALCEAKGFRFWPWEMAPWRAPNEVPEPESDLTYSYAQSIPAAVRLRKRLIAELEAKGRS